MLGIFFQCLHVALTILRFDQQRGGAERYTCDLAEALARRGVRVSVLCGEARSQSTADVVELGMPGLTRLSKYRHFLSALDRHLSAERYDRVHAMLPVRRCDLYHPHAGLAAASPPRKHAMEARHRAQSLAHALNRKRRYMTQIERGLLSQPCPPRVLCLSEYIRTQARFAYSLPEERLPILFNGVDVQRFDPARPIDRAAARQSLGLPADATVALMVAQDFARKGLRQSIAALAAGEERVFLLVAGRDEPAPYRAQARALGVERRVIFAGAVADVQPLYLLADYFVLPTRHDPCSLVALEALASGLPVISTRFNGACDVIAQGRQGYVLESADDVGALAAAMHLLNDPEKRRLMREECLGLRDTISMEHHVDRLLALYES